jgi:protease I
MCETLSGYNVAILAINGFNRRRFLEARTRLLDAGASTTVVSSTRDDLICSWHPSSLGFYTAVDRHVCDAHPAYDALFLPGTVVDPDAVFVDPLTADFIKSFFDFGLPIASLCRDRWLFVHRQRIFGGRLKSNLLFPEIIVSQSGSQMDVVPVESYDELDGVLRKMLVFFETSLTRHAHNAMSRGSSGQADHDVVSRDAMPPLGRAEAPFSDRSVP